MNVVPVGVVWCLPPEYVYPAYEKLKFVPSQETLVTLLVPGIGAAPKVPPLAPGTAPGGGAYEAFAPKVPGVAPAVNVIVPVPLTLATVKLYGPNEKPQLALSSKSSSRGLRIVCIDLLLTLWIELSYMPV